MKKLLWLLLALPALALGQASPGGNAYVPGPTIHGTPVTGNCVEWYNATTLEDAGSACGAGAGSVTSVSVVTANGYSGTVATATTTPAITISGPSIPVSANPSATVGLSAVNGTAATFMTSDSAPPLSVSITPTWTGLHKFTNGDFSLLGTSTGYTQLESANASATNYIATFPAASGTVAFTGAAVACSQLPALTGNVTTSAGACSTTIGASQVTLSMQANFAASSLQGNPTGSPAAPSAITLGSGLAFSGTTLTATGSGSGTVNSGTTPQLAYYATSTAAVSGAANATITAGALALGASGTSGSVALGNATSGVITLQPVTGALGTVTASLPANTGTLAELNLGQTWAALQKYTNADFSLLGSSTGYTLLESGLSGSSNNTLTLPTTATDTIAAIGTAETWTAVQTFTNSDVHLLGSSTGYTTFTSGNSSATNYTLTYPAITDTVVTLTGTQSLTNTFITPRIQSVATATSITPTVGSADFVEQPNTQTAGTLTINAPTGTVVDGQVLTFRINSTAVQTFSWNAAYAAVGGNALPTGTTGGGVTDYFAFRYNSTSSKYEFLARTGGTSSANPSATIGIGAVNGTAGTFMTSDSAPALGTAIGLGSNGIISSPATGQIQLGNANAASPVAQTLSTQGSRGGTDSNVAGANVIIQSGLGTGNSTGSTMTFQTPHAGSTGTTQETATTQLQLGDNFVHMPALASSSAATTGTVCWTTSTGNLTVDTTLACLSSTGRVKKNVKPLDVGLPEVMALRPISYDLKDEYNPEHLGPMVGLIAEDVQKVDPRLVGVDANGDPRGVRYMQMTAVLVRAIQDQQHEIDQLKRQLKRVH